MRQWSCVSTPGDSHLLRHTWTVFLPHYYAIFTLLFTCAAGKAKHYCRHGVIDQGSLRGFEHHVIAEVGSYPHIFIDCPDRCRLWILVLKYVVQLRIVWSLKDKLRLFHGQTETKVRIKCPPDQVLDLKVGVSDVKMIAEDPINNFCQVRSPVIPED